MTVPAEDLDLRRLQVGAYLNLVRIRQAIERHTAALFAQEGLRDVTPAQANVLLLMMQEKRPITARRVAEQLGLSDVTVGRFIHALEQNGWVKRRRQPEDRRAVLVEPTALARQALPQLARVANALLDRAFGGFSRQQIEAITAAVARMRDNLES